MAAADPGAVAKGLRERIFSLSARDLGNLQRSDGIIAALMEFAAGRGAVATWVSLVVIADGTTSLYFGSGGGIIGAGGKEKVRNASRRFLNQAGAVFQRFSKTSAHATPVGSSVVFYVLKPDGVYTSGPTEESEIRREGNPLLPLYAAAQDVITEIRLSSERGEQR